MIEYHHGVGKWLRNQWRGGTRLPRGLRGLDTHLDKLSSIVLEGFWCHLRGLQLSLDELIARHKANQKRWMEEHPWIRPTEMSPEAVAELERVLAELDRADEQ